MKITQDLRAEVQAMGDNERAALEAMALDQAAAKLEQQRIEGMAEKSQEFLKKGGNLYLPAAE